MSPGGPGYLQTITVTSEAEFGTLGKHFGLSWCTAEDSPSVFLGLFSGWPILTESLRKDLLDDGFGNWILL